VTGCEGFTIRVGLNIVGKLGAGTKGSDTGPIKTGTSYLQKR